MTTNLKIDDSVFHEIQEHLKRIEKEHDVIILQAIESGSRAWGFPSPDSDYDVRFIYAHRKDWYLQLSEERDVIDLPINDELDIAGWDLRKALNLANKGNAVVQEWMVSPIVYKQSNSYAQVSQLVHKAFNPMSTYHHYRSMAKKAYIDIEQSEQKKLKRFFYFARATLSAQWIIKNQTMPSIVFAELIQALAINRSVLEPIELLIKRKAHELERSTLEIPSQIYDYIASEYATLTEDVESRQKPGFILNSDFRQCLSDLDF